MITPHSGGSGAISYATELGSVIAVLFNCLLFQEPIIEEDMEVEKPKPVIPVPDTPAEIPTKCVTSRIKTQVNCKVKFIDFEGRSDGESIKRILGYYLFSIVFIFLLLLSV